MRWFDTPDRNPFHVVAVYRLVSLVLLILLLVLLVLVGKSRQWNQDTRQLILERCH